MNTSPTPQTEVATQGDGNRHLTDTRPNVAERATIQRELTVESSAQDLRRVPLVIGVTGHRDLREQDIPTLEERVREIFVKLTRDFPQTPIILLSPLADGADRLAARVALELGLRLVVPLPMRRSLYETDFINQKAPDPEKSLRDFRELLARAERWYELHHVDNYTDEQIRDGGLARDRQYEHVGAYIARHCQILIALWDGRQNNLIGGTGNIVKFQTEGVPEPYAPPRSLIDAVESGPVYHIITPRASNPRPEGEPFTLQTLFPNGYPTQMEAFYRIYENMNRFNADVLEHLPALAESHKSSMEYLFPEEEAKTLPADLRALRERYGAADTLAIYFQKLTQRTLKWLYILITIAAVCFGLYTHLFLDAHLILAFYLLVLVVAHFLVHRRAKRMNYQNKYQDYRTLAEGMRVQFFWCLANLKLSVADHYLRKQKGELDWIRNAIRVWSIPDADQNGDAHTSLASTGQQRLAVVLERWIKDQARYFSKKTHDEHEKLKRHERRSKWLLLAGVLVTVALALVMVVSYSIGHPLAHEFAHHYHTLHGVTILLMSLPPVGAALLHSYTEKTALAEHVKQYGRMRAIFNRADRNLSQLLAAEEDAPQNMKKARELVVDLGIEALAENGDWVLLHRERPIDPPHAA